MTGSEDIVRASGVGCWSWLDGRIAWDAKTHELFDRATAPPDFAGYLECIHAEDHDEVRANIERFVHQGRYDDMEHRVLLPDGRIRWLFARGTVVLGSTGEVRGLEGIVLDITKLKERETRLAVVAETDPLTGLRNRRWLVSEGPREVARCERGAPPFSLAFIDLDDLKRVNDGPGGHAAGDRLLKETAVCLQARLRLEDVLVRVGGDEMVALLPRTLPDEAEVIADRLAQAAAGETPPISVSIGVSTWERGEAFDAVLLRADRAMYTSKARKRG